MRRSATGRGPQMPEAGERPRSRSIPLTLGAPLTVSAPAVAPSDVRGR